VHQDEQRRDALQAGTGNADKYALPVVQQESVLTNDTRGIERGDLGAHQRAMGLIEIQAFTGMVVTGLAQPGIEERAGEHAA
jgi:hypothetical protein